MKILHITPRYYPSIGGSEGYVKALSERFADDGHAVSVLTTTAIDHDALYSNELRHEGREHQTLAKVDILRCLPDFDAIHEVDRPDFKSSAMNAFVDNIQANDCDIVNVFCFPFVNLITLAHQVGHRLHCPIIITPFFHSHPLLAQHFQTMPLRNGVSGADKIICQTRHEADFFLTQWGVPANRLNVIGVGIDTTDEFEPGIIHASEHDDDEALILFLGTNDKLKGAEAVVRLSFRFAGEKVRFVLAGGTTNSFHDFLESVSPLPTENLMTLGRIDESHKHRLLQDMTCLLVPSIAESFGQVYLESWLRKKPVIAVNYGATACLIHHDTDGLLIDFNDIDGMEAAVRRYLDNTELCARHGNAGYNKAKRYDWSLLYPQVKQIYSDLVRQRAAALRTGREVESEDSFE